LIEGRVSEEDRRADASDVLVDGAVQGIKKD
jgi:hypothetical protein